MTDSFLFQSLFEHTISGLAVVDIKGLDIVYINSTFLDIIEYEEGLQGKPFSDLLVLFCGEKNLKATLDQIHRCIKDGNEFIADAIFRDKVRKDKKYIRLHVKPLNETLFFVEAQDISEFEKTKLRMNKAINEAKLTSKLVTIASTQMDNRVILDTVSRELSNAIGNSHIAISVFEKRNGYFELIAETICDNRTPMIGQKISEEDPSVKRLFSTNQPLVMEDIFRSSVSGELKGMLEKRGTVSLLAMPLTVRGEVIGFISFDSGGKHEFSQEEIYLAKHVAGTTGHILEVGRLYSEIQTELSQRKIAENALQNSEDAMLAIYNITSSHTLTYAEKIQAMLSLGCELFEMEMGTLTYYDNGKHQPVEIYTDKYNSAKDLIFLSNQKYCNALLERKEPYTENLNVPGYSFQINENTNFSLKSFMGIQVRVRGLIYGTLIFFSTQSRSNSLTATDREFVRLMAQWMGTEIERDEYLHQLQNYTDEIENKNIELAEARDQAVEISRLKTEFLATVSHEIRTPMNAVIGMTDLLLHTELNKEQKEYAKVVNDSAQLLLKLINDILDFSKIEAGKVVLEEISFDIENAIESSADMFATRAREKGLDLIIYIAKNVPKLVNGDLLRLQQIFMNLLGNAVKFTHAGSILVRAEMVEETQNTFRMRFGVQDTGIGINKEVSDRLFQPFTQADGSTTRKYGGTGLGLAISKRLVELMGGEIGLESEEGRGSNFWFTLTFEKPQEVVFISDQMNEIANTRILVIEKNPTYKEIICQYLKDWNAQAYGVRSLEEMAKLLKADAFFDVIVLDLANLTRLDMFKFSQITKEVPNLSKTRMVFIATIEQKVTREFTDFDMSYRLIKPIKRKPLYETIRNALLGIVNVPKEPEKELKVTTGSLVSSATGALHENEISQVTDKRGEVLLAEDNASNQRLAYLQLAKLGYETICVGSGEEAVEALMSEPERFKFILMDSQMPGMGGLAAASKIRDYEFTRGLHIPIVAMTGNATEEDRAACLKAGMDEYMSKPVTMEKLTEIIAKIFPKRGSVGGTGPLNRRLATRELFPTDNQDTLDENIIAGIRLLQIEGQPDIFTELIDMYCRDSKGLMTNIRKALEDQDITNLKRYVHNLKGASSNVGARKLASFLAVMEGQVGSGSFHDAVDTFNRVETEYLNAYHALERERKVN